MGDHRLRDCVRSTARSVRPTRRCRRPADDVSSRRYRLRGDVGGLRGIAEPASASHRPSAAGSRRCSDDPGVAGDRAYRHGDREPRGVNQRMERGGRASGGHWAKSRWCPRARVRVALAIRDQRSLRSGIGSARPGGAAHRAQELSSPRSARNGVTRERCRPRGAGPLPRRRLGMGGRPNARGARRRSHRRARNNHPIAGTCRPRNRDQPLEAAHVRAGQCHLALVRNQPICIDAARRPRPHAALGLLRASGRAGADSGGHHREHRRSPRRPRARTDRAPNRHRDRRALDGGLRRRAPSPQSRFRATRTFSATGSRSDSCWGPEWAW